MESNIQDGIVYIVNIKTTGGKHMDTDVMKSVTELNAKWRNYVAQILGIDPASPFQVAQGSLGLQSADSSGLYTMSDAVPIDSAAGYYDPSSMNKRSSSYRLLLVSLLPESGSDLKDFLGDMYASWSGYKQKYYLDPLATLTQKELFKKWADAFLDPKLKQQALTVYQQAENSPLYLALDSLNNDANRQTFTGPDSKPYTLYRYTANIENAKKQVAMGSSIQNINFDSASAEGTLKHVFAKGAASGSYSIFSGKAGVSFENLDAKSAKSRITITGEIKKFATLATGPGDWYNSAEVNRAFKANGDNNVWDPLAKQNWDNFFNQTNGSLARYITQFLLVDGYKLTVTIHASYSQEEFQQIKAQASFGIWPFFSISSEANQITSHELNKDGSLSYTVESSPGLIQIWGITLKNAP